MYIREFNLKEQKDIIEYLDGVEFTGFYKIKDNVEITSIDQKCTFDLVNANCKCLLNLLENNIETLTVSDMLDNEYAKDLLSDKTSGNGKATMREATKHEYDKVFGQILEMLSYAEILKKEKSATKRKKYLIVNKDIIRKLAYSELACVAFVCHFVYLLIKDDKDIINLLDKISKNKNNKNLISEFKLKTREWIFKSSNGKHKKDVGQISQKINNPLFYLWKLNKYNTNNKKKIFFGSFPQTINDLSYFRIHKRDIKKQPLATRKENENTSKNLNTQNWEKLKILFLVTTKNIQNIWE